MIAVITLILSLLLCVFIVRVLVTFSKEYKTEVNNGYYDSEIIYKELKRSQNLKKYHITKIMLKIINYFIFLLMSLILVLGLCDKFMGILDYHSIVIATGSMSTKHEENKYLDENHLNNQIQAKDLIVVKNINSLDDINLYDIICYRNEDNVQIVHRVIEKHDSYVKCRGDANNDTDKMDITLEQIVGVYHNFKIPKIGNVIFFVTSYYGMITSICVIFLLFMYTNYKDKGDKEEKKRFQYLINNYLNDCIKEYKITSKYGNLEVKDNKYSFERINDEDDKHDVTSTLIFNGESRNISKTILEGEDNYEK